MGFTLREVSLYVSSQLPNYSQESGRASRDGMPGEAFIMMPVGKQEALQKAHKQAQRRPTQFQIEMSATDKKRIERQKVERFISGAKC